MDRPPLTVADIFRRYGDAYRHKAAASLSTAQPRGMTAIERCRTAALGGHLEGVRPLWTPTRAPEHLARQFPVGTVLDRQRDFVP